jgi:hypothetical protein
MLFTRIPRSNPCFSKTYKKNGWLRSGRRRAGEHNRTCWRILKHPEMECVGSKGSWVGPLDASYRGLAFKMKLGTQTQS